MQEPAPSSDEDYYTFDSKEIQSYPDHKDHDWPATLNGEIFWWCICPWWWRGLWDRLPIDRDPSKGLLMSTTCLLIDPASGGPEVFFSSLIDERMWTSIAE